MDERRHLSGTYSYEQRKTHHPSGLLACALFGFSLSHPWTRVAGAGELVHQLPGGVQEDRRRRVDVQHLVNLFLLSGVRVRYNRRRYNAVGGRVQEHGVEPRFELRFQARERVQHLAGIAFAACR